MPDRRWSQVRAVRIDADAATVFGLLTAVELWPALFPHIRSARVIRRDGPRRLVEVRARWRGLPLGYRSVVSVDASQQTFSIRHLTAWTRGSTATCSLAPVRGQAREVELTLHQSVVVPIPLVGAPLARGFIGALVARELGHAMLARLKAIAEGGSLADRG